MTKRGREDLLEVLACDISDRPAAPGPDELASFIQGASLTGDTLVLSLDEAGADVAQAFVAAEQVCCSSMDWRIVRSPKLALRITASPQQLQILAQLVPSTINIERHQ